MLTRVLAHFINGEQGDLNRFPPTTPRLAKRVHVVVKWSPDSPMPRLLEPAAPLLLRDEQPRGQYPPTTSTCPCSAKCKLADGSSGVGSYIALAASIHESMVSRDTCRIPLSQTHYKASPHDLRYRRANPGLVKLVCPSSMMVKCHGVRVPHPPHLRSLT